MSHKTLTLNNVDPEAATTDNITPTASKGFSPLVETYCGLSVPINDLSGTGTGSDGEYLGYTAGTTTWEGKTVEVSASLGSHDWRYPSLANINVGSYTTVPGERWHLGRKSGGGVVVTALPGSSTDPVTGYGYSGGAVTNTIWPTAFKVAAGHYLVMIQARPRLSGSYSCAFQLKNFTSGDYWGPRVFYDDALSSDSGPTELVGCGSASLNDQIGVEQVDGRSRVADEVWFAWKSIIFIKVG